MGTQVRNKIINIGYKDTCLDSQIGINIVSFKAQKMMTWREAFAGFRSIRILTYSIGLPFIEDLISTFDYAEVIIGSMSQVRQDAGDLFAVQKAVTNYVCKQKGLQKRINDETLHLYVAKDILSHGKIYLMEAADGRKRTILASANASERAWNGSQIENYDMFDDEILYDLYSQSLDLVRDLSTDEISKDAKRIKEDGTNIDELPICKNIKHTNEATVIHDVGDDAEAEFAFICSKMSDDMRQRLREANIRPNKKDGGTVFEIDKVRKMTALAYKKKKEVEKKQAICPQMEIYYNEDTITINGKIQVMNPDIEEVKSDISRWLQYIEGYDDFTGDTAALKEMAWKILNHVFLSPFIARLRYEGSKVQISGRRFPMYLLLAGPRDNGKSALAQTCQQLVLGMLPKRLDQSSLSPTRIKQYDESVKGCPILIDDVTPDRWKYMQAVVKEDGVLTDLHMDNHPTYLFTANKIETVTSDVAKRCIIFRTNNQLKTDAAAEKESGLKLLRDGMTNAWFRAYAGHMFPVIGQFTADMLDDQDRPENWQPDIYRLSSQVIVSLIKECGLDVPEGLREFTWSDYMGEKAISSQAVSSIKQLYHLSPELFTVNRKTDELVINFTNYENKSKMIKLLDNELPADVEKRIFGNKVSMKLDVIQDYAGIVFAPRKGIRRLFRRK